VYREGSDSESVWCSSTCNASTHWPEADLIQSLPPRTSCLSISQLLDLSSFLFAVHFDGLSVSFLSTHRFIDRHSSQWLQYRDATTAFHRDMVARYAIALTTLKHTLTLHQDTIVPADKSSSKAAWRRSLSATVNHEEHPALQSCHAYSTPTADSHTNQAQSFHSSSSTLTSPSPSSPTSKSCSRPSVPQQAHTTPNGYRLGPAGNEGWNSSSSSVHTVRSPRQSSSGASSPRTKHTIHGGVGDGVLVVPAVNEKPVKNVVVEFMGLKLCRVCDALPYCEKLCFSDG